MFGRNYGRALGEKVGRIPRLVDVKFCKMHRTKNFAVSAALLSMICVQGGASIAKQLFPLIGPVATSAMRIGLAALLLNLIIRPNLLKIQPAAMALLSFLRCRDCGDEFNFLPRDSTDSVGVGRDH